MATPSDIIKRGTRAAQPTPSANAAGVLYYVTDEEILERWSGSTWESVEGSSGAGTDTTAIHDNVASEISAITNKANPTDADYLLIEDAAATNAKKHITIANLFEGSNPDFVRLEEQASAPSTPASGFGSVYAKSDGRVYFKNDAGTEYDLTAALANAPASTVAPVGTFNVISGEVTVVDDTNYNAFPSIALMANGDLIVVWRVGTAHVTDKGTIYKKTSSDNGATWSAATQIYTDGTYDARDPCVAVLDNGRVVVTIKLYDHTGGTGITDGATVIYSDDNASTWSSAYSINSSHTDYSGCSAPVIQLPDTTLRLCCFGKDTGDTYESVQIFTSSDRGATWSGEVLVADGQADSRHYQEPNLVLLDNGAMMCMMRSDTDNQFRTTVSYDGGATWSTPRVVFTASGRPSITRFSNKILFVQFRETAADDPAYRISRDDGYTWESETAFGTGDYDYGYQVEYAGGLIGLVYSEYTSGTNADVNFFRGYLAAESGQYISSVPTGTAPLVVASTTKVTNLNADLLDGLSASEISAGGIGSLTDWTPTVTQSGSVTVTVNYAKYVVMGSSLYYITAVLTVTGSGTTANDIVIGNLPAAPAFNNIYGNGMVYDSDANTYYQGAALYISGLSGFVVRCHTETDDVGVDPGFGLANNDVIYITATYPVA